LNWNPWICFPESVKRIQKPKREYVRTGQARPERPCAVAGLIDVTMARQVPERPDQLHRLAGFTKEHFPRDRMYPGILILLRICDLSNGLFCHLSLRFLRPKGQVLMLQIRPLGVVCFAPECPVLIAPEPVVHYAAEYSYLSGKCFELWKLQLADCHNSIILACTLSMHTESEQRQPCLDHQ
jgi:hypothetical protein